MPQDEYQMFTPVGPVSYRPGQPDAPPVSKSPGLKAVKPLPVAERPPWDFLWQRGPTLLDGLDWGGGNGQARSWRMPGIDFLTPYWMIRYFTEVAPPEDKPFPEWVGFAH